MGDNRSPNMLLMGLGVAVGALGGWFFSDRTRRLEAKRTVAKVKKTSRGLLSEFAETARQTAVDAELLPASKKKKTTAKKKQTTKKRSR